MSYSFDQPERLAFEIRRVATERLASALDHLSDGMADDPAVAVHSARKDLKKTRSLLRLVKDSLGQERFDAENARLRDAAHLLAEAREADAQAEALRALIDRFERSMGDETLEAARAWLVGMARGESESPAVALAAARASALIAQAHGDAQLWPLGYESFELIEPGLLRTYRQGKEGLADAIEDPSDATLHEWRKRVKDMWYSLRLVGEAWEPVIRPLADEAHELSELLGNHHDLGQVRVVVEAGRSGLGAGPEAELSALAQARQDEHYRAAISLGRRLYSEGPRRYVEWLRGLWLAWEADTARQASQGGLPSS